MTNTAAYARHHSSSPLTAPSVIAIILIAVNLITFSLWSTGMISTGEDGLLELGQNIFLLLACLLHSNHSKQNGAENPGRYWHGGMALFCFALLLREIDIHQFGANTTWEIIETTVRSLTVFAGVIYAGLVLQRWKLIEKNIHALARSPTLTLTILGCLAYISGWPFDKMIFALSVGISQWIEETLELNATILLFIASTLRVNSDAVTASKKATYC